MALDFHVGNHFKEVATDSASHRYSLSADDHHTVIWNNRKHIEGSKQASKLLNFISDSKFTGASIVELIEDLERVKAELLCVEKQGVLDAIIKVADEALMHNLGVFTVCDQMSVIDCSKVKTKSDFWSLYVDEVEIEGTEHFGRNIDALWDALSAGGPGFPQNGNQLILLNSRQIDSIDNGHFLTQLAEIASDLEESNYSNFQLILDQSAEQAAADPISNPLLSLTS